MKNGLISTLVLVLVLGFVSCEEEAVVTLFNNVGPTDIDNNYYGAVKIGDQVWMSENLKVTKYPNGDAIPYITDNTAWVDLTDDNSSDAYSYYNNDVNSEYGALYTYAAAIGDNWAKDNSDNQGICPDGWHLPSDADWTALETYLANNGHSGTEGVALKSTSGWDDYNGASGNGTDDYGFSALPSGYRHISYGTFYRAGSYGYWWSSTEDNSSDAYGRYLSYLNIDVNSLIYSKSYGFAVRCLRD